jgi:ubiquinone/menaquinone biosynthesis C-methylase UbiE
VIGTFDTLELPDNSVDFILEIDSLHHSDNLVKTLKESARVLKKEGVLIAIDRCHPNSFTDKEVEKALGITYSNEFLKSNGYPQNIILTRRDNGEHEYRLFEYENAFNKAGLEIFSAKVFVCYKIKFKHALKGILSLFPKQLTQLIYKSNNKHLDTPIKWLKQSLKIKNKNQLPESGERTLFILNKK